MKTTRTHKQDTAETATGCFEAPGGLGKLYAGAINRQGHVSVPGHAFDKAADAYDWLREGGEVDAPNAGAGSASKFFAALGLEKVETLDHTSSAGDWAFLIRDGEGGDLYVATQSNRFPRAGFSYSIDFSQGFESAEQAIAFLY